MLRCPRCKGRLTGDNEACRSPQCNLSAQRFLKCAGQPILIDGDVSIVDPATVKVPAQRPMTSAREILPRLKPRNPVAPRVTKALAAEAAELAKPRRPVVLVIGGGTIGSGLESFYLDALVDIVSFDIFPSAFTQFVADAHEIPLADSSVDAVIVQAVLEHVLEPERVVAEIHRVLRPNGLVYADTPFLQQVHEGPFDFTRFTESGHRWLFRRYSLIESGVVAGVGTQLAWSVAHAARSVLPIKGAHTIVRFAMGPVAWLLDHAARPRQAVDGASSVYFFGRRAAEAIQPRDMLDHYRGAQTKPRQT